MLFKMKVDLVRKDKRYTANKRGVLRKHRIDNTLFWCATSIPPKTLKYRPVKFDSLSTKLTWGYSDSLPVLMTSEQWDLLKERIEYEYRNSNYYMVLFDKVEASPKDHDNPVMGKGLVWDYKNNKWEDRT